jgi:PLD-like domain
MIQGEQIRELLKSSTTNVSIIAPFIKTNSFKAILEVIPNEVFIKCVTRWLPNEIASGVSDPEVIYLLEERGNFSLTLADKLHAKIYISDDNRCLTGSANVTQPGLGEANGDNNIEILVETTTSDVNISNTLHAISLIERPATHLEAEKARRLADSLKNTAIKTEYFWFPKSKKAEKAYSFYCSPPKNVFAVDHILLNDIADAKLPNGLNENEFNITVRSLLYQIPLAKSLLDGEKDMMLKQSDAFPILQLTAGSEYTKFDLWLSFVNWISFFYSDCLITQEVTEIALRRAQILKSTSSTPGALIKGLF